MTAAYTSGERWLLDEIDLFVPADPKGDAVAASFSEIARREQSMAQAAAIDRTSARGAYRSW